MVVSDVSDVGDVSCPRCERDHPRGAPECHGHRVGKVFAGKYRVIRVLGAGGMGVVFEVEHQALGRRSALKLLLGRRDGSIAMERFKREAQRLASLKSPAIVQVFDAGHDEDGAPFLEMELLAGASLEDVIQKGPLAPLRVAELARGALAGLDVAHAAGLVHRDIKPDNVFIVGDPATSTEVKLLDFGIAKATEEEDGLTREGAVLGTAYFMSPEQAKSAVGADARSDLYSMGATLYRALTGAYPVEPGPTVAVVAKIVTGLVARHPREVVPAVPAWLDAVVARAMAPEPADRYASALAMRDALTTGATATAGAAEGARPAETEAEDEAPASAGRPALAAPPAPLAKPEPAARGAGEAPRHASPSPSPVAEMKPASREPAAAQTAGDFPTTPKSGGATIGIAAAVAVIIAAGSFAAYRSASAPDAPVSSARPSVSAPTTSATNATTAAPEARRPPPLTGMIALRGGAVALGTLEKEQADELARCKSELAIDARDCTAERIAREVPRAAELRPYDLDALEVDTATFTAWIAAELAAGKATLDAKGVVVAEGQPLLTTGTQHAGVDVAKAPAGTLVVREGFASRPVTMVSWIGANRYCAAHDRRLPTELEWEAAARDGKRTEFPWGDDVPACEAVDFGGTAKRKCAARAPRDVGTSPRDVTRTGVHDLAGSVMEWVDGPGAGADDHPMRGGSWVGSAFEARSARRRFGKAVEMLADLGFRCARDSR